MEKLLSKYGFNSAGYQINIQSSNQKGGQTAFTITNNNYVTNNYGIITRTLSDIDKIALINRIDTILKAHSLPKTTLIKMHVTMGNDENFVYANEIGRFLSSKGYNVNKELGLVSWTGVFRVFFDKDKIFLDVGLASMKAHP